MVDLPAPFSPIRACTSPGNSRRSTPESAGTPPNAIEMSRISITGWVAPGATLCGWTSICVIFPPPGRLCPGRVLSPERRRGADWEPARQVPGRLRSACRSVLTGGQGRGGLRLVEGAFLGDHALRHRLTGHDLLGQVHQ